MRIRPKRLMGLLIALALALQWAFPALAVSSQTGTRPSTSLLPSWYISQTVPQSAILSLAASASPNPVSHGELLSTVLTVSNEATVPAREVVVTAAIPRGAVFESASVVDDGGARWLCGGPATGEGGRFRCFTTASPGTESALPARETAARKLVVRVVGPLPDPGWIHSDPASAQAANAATAYGPAISTAVRPSASASSATTTPPPEETSLQPREPQTIEATALSIDKMDSPDPVNLEGLLTYVITVTNNTADEVEQVVVTDTTPAGTVFENASVLDGGGASWFYGGPSVGESGDFLWFTSDRFFPSQGGLPGNRSAVLKLVVRVARPFPDQGLVHNDRYSASGSGVEEVQGPDRTTLVNAPAWTLAKIATPHPVTAGERLTYTITLTNSGHLTTSLPYTITEVLPSHTAYAGASPNADISGEMITWTLPSALGVGQAVSVTLAVTVESPLTDGLTIVNDAYRAFSSEVTPTVQGPAVQTQVESWPLLSLSKSGTVDPVQAGEPLTYTIRVSNDVAANGPAQGVVITDRVPLNTSLIAAPGAAWSGTGPGSLVTWTLPAFLWPGEQADFSLTVLAHSPLYSGTLLTNQAVVSATNALAPADTSLDTTVNAAPALETSKSVYPDAVVAGATVTYTIRVTNTGNEIASGTEIVDDLPPLFSFGGMVQGDAPSVSDSRLTWADQIVTPTTVAITPPGWVTPPGPLTLVFTATAAGNDTYPNAVTATHPAAQASTGPTAPVIVGSPDLRIHKQDSVDPISPGQPLTYTLVYSNASPVPASGVVLTDTLPAYITGGVANPAPDQGVIAAGQTVTWFVGPLDESSGDHAIQVAVTLTVPIPDSTILINAAGIRCEEGVEATTTATTTISSGPDMVLAKSATPAPPSTVSPDEWVTYTLVFGNAGTATASATVTDVLPISLTDILSTTTANVAFAGGTPPLSIWAVSPLAPGEQGMITITGRVMTATLWGQQTRITNTAGITTPADVLPGNNDDAAPVIVVPGAPAAITLIPDPAATSVDCSSVVTAVVQDAWGNPVQDGTLVTFATGTATSAATPPTGTTTLGVFASTISSTRPGTVVVTATAPNLASGATSVAFAAGAPDAFAFGPIADPQTAGESFTIVLTATDQYGNVASGYNGTATLVDSTGTLLPAVTGPGSGGILTQSVTITQAATGVSIDASASGTTACGDPWAAGGSSSAFDVVHNLAATLDLAPKNSSVAAGSTQAYTAMASDAYGNPWDATGEVTFTTSGGNTFPGTPPGNNVFSATLVGMDYPVTATVAGAGGPVVATTGVTVTHGPAVLLSIAPRDRTVVAGTAVAYTAVATDAFGNDWSATGETNWSAGGGNSFSGNVLSATVAGTWTVEGSLPGASDSTPITITPAAVSSLAMAPVGDPQTAGDSFTLTITARDDFGNPVTSFNGTLNLTDATGTLAPGTWSSWSNGVAAPSMTILQAATDDRITATLAATPTIQVVSNLFDVVGNVPATVVYTAPASLRLCEQAPVTVTVTDAWGNPVADGAVVSLTASIGLQFVESGSAYYYPTTTDGQVAATLQAGNTAGLVSTQARAGSAGSGVQWIDVISPGVPYAIDLVATPSSIAAFSGTATITATVYDCAATPNRLAGETVDFAADFGSPIPPSDVTDGNGEATTVYSSTRDGTATITATASNALNTVQVVVQPPEHRIYLPLMLNNHIGVNLLVESIAVAPASPAPDQAVVITVTIRNVGSSAASSPFWVDLYLDPSEPPSVGTRWDQICDEGVAWEVPALGAGQSLALRSDQGAPSYTYWSGQFEATPDPHQLYAVVDIWPGPDGAVAEEREDDNILGPQAVNMGP